MRVTFWALGRAIFGPFRRAYQFLRAAGRPDPGHVPHFSMTRAERWFYFHTVERLLAPLPWIVWRTPAALIATVRVCWEGYTDDLARELLTALGRPADRAARWRFRWHHWYLEELDRFLLIQGRKLTPTWIERHVTIVGAVPTGGAILIGPHQALRRLAMCALSGQVRAFGGISGSPASPEAFARIDVTMRHVFTRRHILTNRYLTGGRFSSHGTAVRRAVPLLRDGGYLNSLIDSNSWQEPRSAIFGRWLTLFTTGTIWLARKSGRPIVPYMLVPQGRKMVLWIGTPIEPDAPAIAAAIEACLRRAPASWERTVAMVWLRAPRADGPGV